MSITTATTSMEELSKLFESKLFDEITAIKPGTLHYTTTGTGPTTTPYIVDDPVGRKAPKVLKAKVRMNKSTMERYSDPAYINRIVREKLVKQLFQQLIEQSGVIKVTSNVSPATHAVTFEAELQVLPND